MFARTQQSATTPVVLRLGMIFGRGILMVDAARWLARRRPLCVWREQTLLQLLSVQDFLRAAEAAIVKHAVFAHLCRCMSVRKCGDSREAPLAAHPRLRAAGARAALG